MDVLPFVLLNGALTGMLLFMLAAGLTLVYGLMGIINFAHASFYMLGAYLGYQFTVTLGFVPGLILAPAVLGLLGVAFRRLILFRIGIQDQVRQLLITFGAAMVVTEGVQMIWGRYAVAYHAPKAMLEPLFNLGGLDFPIYRFFILAVATGLFAAIYGLLRFSRVGLILTAAQARPQMVRAMGYDLDRIHDLVFGLGLAVAGLAGAMAGPMIGVYPVMAERIISLLFVVVVVGGLGSLIGALVVSLVLGLIDTAAVTYRISLEPVVNILFGPQERGTFLFDIASI
ncbi:MAG: branched-chain amino acid ABC transporter permease, partial [Paracoccaceae bacterium]